MPAAAATDCIGEVTIGERGREEEEREEGEEGGEGRGREKGTSAVAGGTGGMVPSGGAM